jgi:UDP-2,3-diacylglucosamine hydrolase
MRALLLSDLHLAATRVEQAAGFRAVLAGPARVADGVYLLGDLFEVWVGDDSPDPFLAPIKEALCALTKSGVPVYLQVGNRDFLIGERFLRETGITLLPDFHVLAISTGAGTLRAVLTHGDLLCTADRGYQAFRALVRHPWSRWLYLALPLSLREGIAVRLRRASKKVTQTKEARLQDVDEAAVRACLTAYDARLLIHGHTHHAAIHEGTDDQGRSCRRIVLPDWYGSGGGLWLTAAGDVQLLSLAELLASVPGAGAKG